MQNFKIIAYLLLGSTDSRGCVRFTPKYSIVGGEGGVSDFFKGCDLILLEKRIC
jgi:hypothetical protein